MPGLIDASRNAKSQEVNASGLRKDRHPLGLETLTTWLMFSLSLHNDALTIPTTTDKSSHFSNNLSSAFNPEFNFLDESRFHVMRIMKIHKEVVVK